MHSRIAVSVISILTLALMACAGSKVLKDPIALHVVDPLAVAESDYAAVALAWVIVRDGPGTWARNADWDEYILVVRNLGAAPLRVTSVALHDALGERVTPEADRRALVRASRDAVRRYREAELEVKAGFGGGTLAATGAVAWYGVAAPIAAASVMGATGGAAVVVGVGAVIAGPVLAVGGLMRANNNRKVNNEILRRQTVFPIALAPGEERTLTVFFPLTPSPSRVDIELGAGIITIDTGGVLTGLHLPD